jgi:hypothetical protein
MQNGIAYIANPLGIMCSKYNRTSFMPKIQW